jgi:hypothetical protein
MNQSNGFPTSSLIDFLRDSTEAALDLSKNLTAAHSPGDLLNVWTRFAEGQYSAAERFSHLLTGHRLATMDQRPTDAHRANGSSHPAAAAAPESPESQEAESKEAESQEAENAAQLFDLQEQADSFRSRIDELTAQVAALSEKLAALEHKPPRVKFSFGEPPHTGWTPSKVVVLGRDANGDLVELPSTIEEGGFRYTGAPSFWIAIG